MNLLKNIGTYIMRFIISMCICWGIFILISIFYKDVYPYWGWIIITSLIVSVLFLFNAFIAGSVLGIGSFIGYAIYSNIIADQYPHITMTAGMLLFKIQVVSIILAIILQILQCILKKEKAKKL